MERKFRNYTVWLLLFAFTGLISCGNGDVNFNVDGVPFPTVPNTDFEAEEPFSFDVPAGNRSRLILQGINSEIGITGQVGANSVTITGVKRVGSDSLQDAEAQLQNLDVDVQELAADVVIRTIQPLVTGGRRYEVDYTITLPSDFEIQVANANGIVMVDAINDDVTVSNVNGSVTLANILGSALVSIVNGLIESEVTLPLNGTVDLNTANGNINLTVPVNTSAQFMAVVNLGSISISNLVLQNEVITPTSRSGTLGTGQGTISLEAEATGSISVSGF